MKKPQEPEMPPKPADVELPGKGLKPRKKGFCLTTPPSFPSEQARELILGERAHDKKRN